LTNVAKVFQTLSEVSRRPEQLAFVQRNIAERGERQGKTNIVANFTAEQKSVAQHRIGGVEIATQSRHSAKRVRARTNEPQRIEFFANRNRLVQNLGRTVLIRPFERETQAPEGIAQAFRNADFAPDNDRLFMQTRGEPNLVPGFVDQRTESSHCPRPGIRMVSGAGHAEQACQPSATLAEMTAVPPKS